MVVLTEARPGRFPGWLIGCFRCFTLLPSGERSSPLGASADVQVFSVVFTFGACSSSILGAHHSGDLGGARTLYPFSVSSLVDSTLLLYWLVTPYKLNKPVSGSRRTELTRSCQGPPLKSEWRKVGSNSEPSVPDARTLPILHASLRNCD